MGCGSSQKKPESEQAPSKDDTTKKDSRNSASKEKKATDEDKDGSLSRPNTNRTRKNSVISEEPALGTTDVIDQTAKPQRAVKATKAKPMAMENGYVASRRRSSVSAEAMNPNMVDDDEEKVFHEKTEEALERIRKAASTNLLFRDLLEEVQQDVYDAMFERQIKQGDSVISQGEYGDFFYVVDSGMFNIFVASPDDDEEDIKVLEVGPGGSFGELALMYNSPRAATCTAATDSVVWALDRMTFRRTILSNTAKKRELYEEFLKKVEILGSLEFHERAMISNALQPMTFQDGEYVVRQGEQGDHFYLVEEGEFSVRQTKNGEEREISRLGMGDYFGEIALLKDEPRVASVIADGKCRVATLDSASFSRLVGSLTVIMQRNIALYKKFEDA